jgi:hypothetical protein
VLPLNSLADPPTDAPARCTAAFEAYVGRPSGGSIYVTFPAIPAASDSSKPIVCLVARADGSWMDHQARGSGK